MLRSQTSLRRDFMRHTSLAGLSIGMDAVLPCKGEPTFKVGLDELSEFFRRRRRHLARNGGELRLHFRRVHYLMDRGVELIDDRTRRSFRSEDAVERNHLQTRNAGLDRIRNFRNCTPPFGVRYQ